MHAVAPRLVGVAAATAGTAVVGATELKRKLGRGAWAVWLRLAALRDRRGFVHPTIRGIARLRGHAVLSERAVRKGLVRLRTAGLVRDIGWTDWQVHDRGSLRVRKVYLREVYGAELLEGRRRAGTWADLNQSPEPQCAVPHATATWLASAACWGGARQGAGRKTAPPQGGKCNPERGQSVAGEESSGAHPGNSSGAPDSNNTLLERTLTSFPKGKTRAGEPRVVGSPGVQEDIAGLGGLIGGAGSNLDPGGLPPGCPAYPGPNVVEAAKVPTPPRLTRQQVVGDPEAAVRLILRAYRGAVKGRLGLDVHPYRRGGLTRSKHFSKLVECALQLAEHEIPPTSWAGFSCDVWAKGGDHAAETVQRLGGDKEVKKYLRGSKGSQGKAPALTWVMSAHRVEKWRGWFRTEASSYAGGRLVYGDALRTLLGRWQRMRTRVRRRVLAGGATAADVQGIVDKCFPAEAGGYDGMVDAAKRETQREQARLERCVLRGDWVW